MIDVTVYDLHAEELLRNMQILRSTRANEVKEMIRRRAAERLMEGQEATRSRVFLGMGCMPLEFTM